MARHTYEPMRIFISSCRKDSAFARHLAQKLRAVLGSAARVWFDEERGDEEARWSAIADELTASTICIVVMSDFARHSRPVKDMLKIAWNQRRFHKDFLLMLVICRAMRRIPPAFDALPMVSFVRVPYETAFAGLLKVMKLELLSSLPQETQLTNRASVNEPTAPLPDKQVALTGEPGATTASESAPTSQKEALLDIRNEIDTLLEQSLARMSAHFYHLQGLTYLYEDDSQRAQWALERALELSSEPAQRLALLDEYTALLVTWQEWEEVLQRAEEALAIAPTDPIWQFVKEEALKRIATNLPEALLPL